MREPRASVTRSAHNEKEKPTIDQALSGQGGLVALTITDVAYAMRVGLIRPVSTTPRRGIRAP
jgi:hypothetical protein